MEDRTIAVDKYLDYNEENFFIEFCPLKSKRFDTLPGWGTIVKVENFPVAVYINGEFKEVVYRTARPRAPFGAWSVYAVKYHNKVYTSLVDDIYGYLTIKLQNKEVNK